MNYRLIVITHGGDETAGMLLDTLASFEEMVTPSPRERVLIEDGERKDIEWRGTRFWSDKPLGFCVSAARAWEVAAAPGVEWVYWLEHDFVHHRPVNLEDLAAALTSQPRVAQMSLMRQPVNAEEIRAGGVVNVDAEAFVPKIASVRTREILDGKPVMRRHKWLEHGRYWTTNPSLFRRGLAAEWEWPSVKQECEGHHSIRLRQAGYSFGVWGRGEPWVVHVGERTGFGY